MAKKPKPHQEGICPACGAWLKYGPGFQEDDRYYYNWDCPKCRATGREWYTMTFDGHIYEPYDAMTRVEQAFRRPRHSRR